MITCPSCAHSNPDGAVNCEACFTALPIVKTVQCPSCNSKVMSDARFCGHCGFNLGAVAVNPPAEISEVSPDPDLSSIQHETSSIPPIAIAMNSNSLPDETTQGNTAPNLLENLAAEVPAISISEPSAESENVPAALPINLKTQLQQFTASLLHVQTNLNIEIPAHLPVVHIGKLNNVIPPDIDVSGFPDSDIVSRIHADIRADGGAFYFEDTGSSNGTYINNLPLPVGNRHKLRAGDRISLGKGDKVSFIFQFGS